MSTNGPAVLTARLLARKGTAVPTGFTVKPLAVQGESASASHPTERTLRLVEMNCPSESEPRSRITLRLDKERHLRLRLTAAHLQTHLQTILTDALDRYLDQIGPEVLPNKCACLAVRNDGKTVPEPRGVDSDATNCDSWK